MALAMVEVVDAFNQRTKQHWQIRIGSTPARWSPVSSRSRSRPRSLGDTVNIASRLESHGEAGIVAGLAGHGRFAEEKLQAREARARVKLKNRGDMMAYRLLGRKV